MYEEKVREYLESALLAKSQIRHEEPTEHPQVSTLRDYGMLTSDEGLVLSFEDGSVFTIHIGCYRRPEEPDEAAVA